MKLKKFPAGWFKKKKKIKHVIPHQFQFSELEEAQICV